MARRTDWQEKPGETYLGSGQRMFATDVGEYPLLEISDRQTRRLSGAARWLSFFHRNGCSPRCSIV